MTAMITLNLTDEAQRYTPLNIGLAISDALKFGTDDLLYTYEDEAYTLPLMVNASHDAYGYPVPQTGSSIGTITLGPAA